MLCLVPTQIVVGEGTTYYGPKYFRWRFNAAGIPAIESRHYGHKSGYFVEADLNIGDLAFLQSQSDVYVFPENIDVGIPPQDGLRTQLENFKVPTDWITPSTTFRQFIQKMSGIINFSQRFARIAFEQGYSGLDLFDTITLETRYRDFPDHVAIIFDLTVQSYGVDPAFLRPNSTVRQMLKTAGDFLEEPMSIGGKVY